LGATVFTFKGQDVADTILRFANEYRCGQVVIGRPRPEPWWKRLTGHVSVAEQLIHRSHGVTIIVVDAESDERTASTTPAPKLSTADLASRPAGTLTRLLPPNRILIWDDPVSRWDVRQALVRAVIATTPSLNENLVLDKLAEREKQGSTFLNEGVALPHARIEGLDSPQCALGLTHAGFLDVQTEKPIETVFLLLSPASGASVHLQLLAKVGRALQSRDLRRALSGASTPEQAAEAIQDFEAAASGKAG
jgi:two-component system sensor histidine kinase KdpD